MTFLLHADRLARIPFLGSKLTWYMQRRVRELADKVHKLPDPAITILIRTHNDAPRLEQLFADIAAQDFSGPLQVVVVDTESSDNTLDIARRHGATIVRMRQADFTYPKSLNLGFAVAKHDFVLCLVGHSSLTNTLTLKTAAYYATDLEFGGAYNFGLPDTNARGIERMLMAIIMLRLLRRPAHLDRARPGLLAGNASLVRRAVWQKLGGYDEAYAAGGEDSALGRSMLAAGYHVFFEPALSIYHSHELGIIDGVRQMREWRLLDRPQPFNESRLKKFRRDLR